MELVEIRPDGAKLGLVALPGERPTCLCLHGLGATASYYFASIALEPAWPGREIWMADLLGAGISDRPQSFDYSVFSHADAIARALDSLGGEARDVVGHSLSGAIATVLAHRRPDLVRRLVVIEPSVRATERAFSDGQTEDEFVERGFARALEEAGPGWRATMQLTDPVAFFRDDQGLGDPRLNGLAGLANALPMPTLLMVGADSGYRVEDAGLDMPTVVIPDSGHCPTIEQPAATAAALAEFLA